MKKKTILNTSELPAIHKTLKDIMACADYDLQKLKQMKPLRKTDVGAKQMQVLIQKIKNGALSEYEVNPVTGVVQHKFSDACNRPLHQAIRFRDNPDTRLVSIRLTTSTPLWDFFITEAKVMKKLMPQFRSHKQTLALLEQAIKKSPLSETEKAGIKLVDCLAQSALSVLAYEHIAGGFLKAGMQSFIMVNDDMFLVLPEEQDMANNIIAGTLEETGLDNLFFLRVGEYMDAL